MRLAIIGRTKWLYETAATLRAQGHDVGLVITAREAPEYTCTVEDFRRLAADCGAPFLVTPTLETPAVGEAIAAAGDLRLAVSMNFTAIISQADIDRFTLGILNAHGGDLPRYRGNACQAWAIINGESRVGLCVHRMIGGELDSGDIIARAYRPLVVDHRIGEVLEWLGLETPRLFLEAVTKLEADPAYVLERQSKEPADALRCYPRRPEDGRIDWRQTNEQVLRLVNASSEPFAGAFCTYEGTRLTIWRAKLHANDERYIAVPGQVAAVDGRDGSIVVICGTGKLRITDVTYRDQRVPPASVIRGIRNRLT